MCKKADYRNPVVVPYNPMEKKDNHQEIMTRLDNYFNHDTNKLTALIMNDLNDCDVFKRTPQSLMVMTDTHLYERVFIEFRRKNYHAKYKFNKESTKLMYIVVSKYELRDNSDDRFTDVILF
ncbi:MAG: hypothetical protein KBT28_06925 [Bacteroidales bacterium]|nr:hypothetical protein [Candidatus Colimorpha merdihippi]